MTDDEQLTGLLTQASELPDDVQPPMGDLLAQARRRRSLRLASALLASAVIVAAAAGLPVVLRSAGRSPATHGSAPVGPATAPPPGPTAAQIVRFRWSQLPASPLGPRSQPLLAWAGNELLELGGFTKGVSRYDGAAFNPATGSWHSVPSPAPYNVGFWNAVDVWTGRQLFVTNNQEESCGAPQQGTGGGTPESCWPHAGLYDPRTNSWTATKLPSQLYGLDLMSAVWTGRQVILAGVNSHYGRLGVAAYDPSTNHWQVITPTLRSGHPPRYVTMIALPGRLLLWSMWDNVTTHKNGYSDKAGLDVLSLGTDGTWRVVTGHWPQDEFVTAPAYTGRTILLSPETVWCGVRCPGGPGGTGPGYFVDPTTLTRTPIPPGPLWETSPTYTWTGRTIIAIDRYTEVGNPGHYVLQEDDMALYNPSTRGWTRLPAPPGYPKLAAPPTWTGTQLLELSTTGQLASFHR